MSEELELKGIRRVTDIAGAFDNILLLVKLLDVFFLQLTFGLVFFEVGFRQRHLSDYLA